MENKSQSTLGGRVGKARIETTSCNQTKNNLKRVGLDTSLYKHSGLLDQRIIL